MRLELMRNWTTIEILKGKRRKKINIWCAFFHKTNDSR